MSPERWQQIEKTYYAALDVEAAKRAAFLNKVCAGDDELRREVDSLLASHERAGAFLASPALEIAARAVVDDKAESLIGRQVGPYRITSLLGVGGMGEVYLAKDTRLDRQVALKLLAAHFSHDEDRLQRFRQEALAASALNHPNIVTVYEVGEWEGRQFIATEFVEGITLRTRMRNRRVSTADAVDIAVQITGALAAAHSKGIVHRDIKPENVMVRPDGLVKVLDFGVAKYVAPTGARAKREALVHTTPGIPIGTAAYMSPEQARGLPIDARTDIWSLGVILYEMLARRLPFPGATPTDRIAAILGREPVFLSKERGHVAPELERIVNRTLAKNKEDRYGSAADLAAELRNFRSTLAPQRIAGFDLPAPMRSLISFTQRRMLVALLALTLIIGAVFIGGYFYLRGDRSIRTDSIAILPLSNGSNDPNMEYLSDGITESIISNLAQLSQLRVIARSTVFRYKDKNIDPQKVGQELGVRAVLMGRVIQRGENLAITTELVNVSDGTRMWGGQYNRKFADVFALQEEIAREISEKLRLRLTGEDKKLLAKRYTDNTEAYQLYLLGRFHWNKFTEEGVKKSIDYYNQALANDPNYALAYFGLFDAYSILGQIGYRPNEVLPKALVYLEKALALDPNLLEAHFARGGYELFYGFNWTVAEQELKRAFEPNTNVGGAHDLYGQLLVGMGRFDEGIAENKRALEFVPLSPISNSNLGEVYYFARQYDQAIAQCRKTLELDPNFFLASLYIGWSYGQQEKYQEAIAELTRTRELPGGFGPATSELGYVYAVSGQRAEAQKLVRELQERAKRGFVDPYYIAIVYVGLGDREQALAWLNKAYEERSFWLLWLKVEPKFDHLRGDRRFNELVQRVGLPS